MPEPGRKARYPHLDGRFRLKPAQRLDSANISEGFRYIRHGSRRVPDDCLAAQTFLKHRDKAPHFHATVVADVQ